MKWIVSSAIALAGLACCACTAIGQEVAARGLIVVAPERVEISLFFDGANIEVITEVPAGYEAAVRLMAHPERLELKKLGKKAGLVWMNVGDARFENIPAVYQVLSSARLADIGTEAERAQWMLGYDALLPDAAPYASLRAELVGLKERDGSFAVREEALHGAESQTISTDPLSAGTAATGDPPSTALPSAQRVLRGFVHLPASVPAGDYALDLIGFKNRRVVHLGSTTLHVEHVGVVRRMRTLATDHGLIYGIAASLFAVIAGLVTGRAFRSKSDEGH